MAWLELRVDWPSGTPAEGEPLVNGAVVELESDGLRVDDVTEILTTLALTQAKRSLVDDAGVEIDEVHGPTLDAHARLRVIDQVVHLHVEEQE